MVSKDPNKVDLRLEEGLREQVEKIAVSVFGAKKHHISQRPELTTTLNRLIKIGINAINQDKSAALGIVAPGAGNRDFQDKINALDGAIDNLRDKLADQARELEAVKNALSAGPLTQASALAKIQETTLPTQETATAPAETIQEDPQKSALPAQEDPAETESETETESDFSALPGEPAPSAETLTLALWEGETAPEGGPEQARFPDGLEGKELGQRLGLKDGSGISHWFKKGAEELARRSAEKDPEGIAWERRADTDKKYYPIRNR